MSRVLVLLALVATTRVALAEPPPTLRLDGQARPLRYAARVAVDPASTTFHGSIDISMLLARAHDVVWLNGTQLTVDKAWFDVGGKAQPARVVAGGVDFIGFASPLPAGAATLHVEYAGKIARSDDQGLFAQLEGGRWYAITQLEPLAARRVFPCFDEPQHKVPWTLTLDVPRGLAALSNTRVVSEEPVEHGMRRVRYAETAPLPSYLVAFAVGPYEIIDAGRVGKRPTPMRIAVPSGRAIDAAYAAKVSGELLGLVEQYFGIPYPFDKLDNVTVPATASFGAMENVGMVTFAQGILVAKAADHSIDFERDYAATATHEYAHQWFGDLVTAAWWDDLWLNEGFASWLEAKLVDAWRPDWSHGTARVEARGAALSADALVSARRIRQPIVTSDDVYNAFDVITYQKGASVLAMFERWVGADAFREGIRSYVGLHANGSATADDFIAAISGAAKRDVGPAFHSFLDQPGAPIVDVKLLCEAGRTAKLALHQQRYVPVGSRGAHEGRWQIPVCVRWAQGDKTERACTLLSDAEQSMTLGTAPGCPTWLLANDEATGYYRTGYPSELLEGLLQPASLARMDLAETLGVFGDLRAQAHAGKLQLGDALMLTPALARDERRAVVEQVLGLVEELGAQLVQPADRAAYARYIDKLFGERARQLGWVPRAGESEDTTMLRPELVLLVATDGEDPTLRTAARALAVKWLASHDAVSADVAATVLHVAARDGDRALFDQLVAAARRSRDRHERHMLYGALGSFRDPALVRAALELVDAKDLDVMETFSIVYGVSRERATRQLGWDYLRQRFDRIAQRLPPESATHAFRYGVSFCDEQHQRELDAFFHDRASKLPGGPRRLAQAIEEVELCRAYVAAQRESVSAFLRGW